MEGGRIYTSMEGAQSIVVVPKREWVRVLPVHPVVPRIAPHSSYRNRNHGNYHHQVHHQVGSIKLTAPLWRMSVCLSLVPSFGKAAIFSVVYFLFQSHQLDNCQSSHILQ